MHKTWRWVLALMQLENVVQKKFGLCTPLGKSLCTSLESSCTPWKSSCRRPWVKHTHSNSKSPYFLIFREDGVVVYSLVKNFCLRPSRSVQKHVNATSCAYRTHLRAYSLLSVWRTWKQTSISQRMDCRQKKWRCKNNAWRSTCDAKTSQSSYKYVILNDT